MKEKQEKKILHFLLKRARKKQKKTSIHLHFITTLNVKRGAMGMSKV